MATPEARACEAVPVQAWRRHATAAGWSVAAGSGTGTRVVPAEAPVALTYNRATQAVMLATPADLEDFGYGFSLNERIIDKRSDIE